MIRQRKEIKRSPLRPGTKPIARESEKAKARRLGGSIAQCKKRNRPKATNAARKKREFARAYGSKARVEWVKRRRCCMCAVVGYSENAHTEGGGTGRKAHHTTIAPLCGPHDGLDGCHRDFDQHRPPFDGPLTRALVRNSATETEAEWLAHVEATG